MWNCELGRIHEHIIWPLASLAVVRRAPNRKQGNMNGIGSIHGQSKERDLYNLSCWWVPLLIQEIPFDFDSLFLCWKLQSLSENLVFFPIATAAADIVCISGTSIPSTIALLKDMNGLPPCWCF